MAVTPPESHDLEVTGLDLNLALSGSGADDLSLRETWNWQCLNAFVFLSEGDSQGPRGKRT